MVDQMRLEWEVVAKSWEKEVVAKRLEKEVVDLHLVMDVSYFEELVFLVVYFQE
jgi:hypothetical protein